MQLTYTCNTMQNFLMSELECLELSNFVTIFHVCKCDLEGLNVI